MRFPAVIIAFSVFVLSLLFAGSISLWNAIYNPLQIKASHIAKRDRMDLAMKQEFELTRDPNTNTVPRERLIAAMNYADQLRQNAQNNRIAGAIAGITWTERGPKNVGGRTRAIMIDPNDPTFKTVFAAGVGGGLWKTADITQPAPSWTPVNDFFSNIAITALCYNPSSPNIMYFGTGEGWYNADAISGDGIWKSTDGGVTFTQLASTAGTANFSLVNKIVVHPLTGDVYAATTSGLFRSQNGGTTWTKVLGAGVGGGVNDMADVEIAADNSVVAATGRIFSGADGVYRSTTGNSGTFIKLNTGNGFPTTGFERIEIACAPSNASVIYALTQDVSTYGIFNIYKTINQGVSWTTCALPNDADPGIAGEFTRGQAWYDFSAAVDPNNANTLVVGGVDLFKSTNGGTSWTQLSHWYGGFGFQEVHADQHAAIYQPGNSSVLYFGNDGGCWRSTDGGTTIAQKSYNYNVTQFYACAINPGLGSNQFMAGAQDNGTQQYSSPGINNTIEVTGGDGAFCHIDQSDPLMQYSSYVYNNIYRSNDGGLTFTSIRASNNGSFINPSDFDDTGNNFYACYLAGQFTRLITAHTSTTWSNVAISQFNGARVTAVTVSPTTANRVFFGLNNGRIVRVDNANGATPTGTWINSGTGMIGSVSISSIACEKDDDTHLLATISNYGANSVWETKNGGTTWTSVEGNLPDMPVRSVMFSPLDSSDALVATEVGVWTTDNLNGGSTAWGPSNSGLANVRTDYLQVRSSDNMIIAATHGRGLFSTDFYAPARPDFTADLRLIYNGKTIAFTDGSVKSTSWLWNFGDGFTSTSKNPTHTYVTPGVYNVSLQINGTLSEVKNTYIQVLPNRGTPYTPALGGNFESNVFDFGAESIGGTRWQRGNSAVTGKNGTNSGTYSWVTNLTGNYSDNAYALFYTPNYNFTAAGTYTLRFYRKNSCEAGYDGFQVEYSLNKGTTWALLGTAGAGWYDFANGAGGTAFPAGSPFFNAAQATFLQTNYNVSALAGNANVAFRFVFRSDGSVTTPGVALDDFEIIGPTNNSLPVTLVSFTGRRISNYNQLSWTTLSEVNNKGFFVLRSNDGKTFTEIGFVNGSGTVNDQREYSLRDFDLTGKVVYYRLRQVDFDGKEDFSRIIALRNADDNALWVQLFPMPLQDNLNLLFAESLIGKVQLRIYDSSGSLVLNTSKEINGVTFSLPLPESQFKSGVYFVEVNNGARVVRIRVVKL